MSALLSAAVICERALRKIGAFSINDSGADGAELEEASFWLDMVVAELVGTERCTWLVEDTITVALTADTASYNLKTVIGTAAYPADGLVHVVSAWVTDGTNDNTVKIYRRKEFEEIIKKTASGKPEYVYIDRLSDTAEQTIYLFPVPTVTTWSLKLVIQKGAPDLREVPAKTNHGFHVAWQKWLVLATAAEIADGPVRALPDAKVDRIKRDARLCFNRLQSSQNRELQQPRRVKAFGA